MVQKFVTLEIDADYFYCDTQFCNVYIFMCEVGGVCPGCFEIGKLVGNLE